MSIGPEGRHVSKKNKCIKKNPARIKKKIYIYASKKSRCHCVRPHGFRAANLDQKKNIPYQKKIT
jgi:hypothetical protein